MTYDPLCTRRRCYRGDLRFRLMARVRYTAYGCWEWSGALTKDRHGHRYGAITVERKSKLAHRMAYEVFVGPIPTGLELDHLCRNTCCINPSHLEPVTHQTNMSRGVWTKGRVMELRLKTECPQGHPYDEANTIMSGRSRRCRECNRVRSLAAYYRSKSKAT